MLFRNPSFNRFGIKKHGHVTRKCIQFIKEDYKNIAAVARLFFGSPKLGIGVHVKCVNADFMLEYGQFKEV